MKKIYFQPQTKVESAECVVMLAGSLLDNTSDSQNITPSDDEFNGEFYSKQYEFDW